MDGEESPNPSAFLALSPDDPMVPTLTPAFTLTHTLVLSPDDPLVPPEPEQPQPGQP